MSDVQLSYAAAPSLADRCLPYADGLCQWSLVLLGLLPFVVPHHYQPFSTFFQESLALLLGLFAFVPVVISGVRGQFAVPRVVGIPLLLVAVACLQLLLLDFPAWQEVAVFILYVSWGGMLACVGRYVAAKPDLGAQTARLLAWSILFGACFNAFAVWAQIIGVAKDIPFIFSTGNFDLVGNLAQTNLLATYLALGICALIYLEAIEDFPTAVSWPILLVLVGTGFWTGSRMFILELVAGAILAFAPKGGGDAALWRRLRVSVALALVFYGVWYLAKTSGLTEMLFSVQFDRTGRVVTLEMTGTLIRLGLWKAAAEMAVDNPWLGIGVGNYDWVSFEQMKLFSASGLAGYIALGDAENAHNLVLHLAAEMGPLVGVVLVVWLLRWAVRAWARQEDGAAWWLVASAGALLVHALLEYPFWYAYYLGLVALFMGWRSEGLRLSPRVGQRLGAVSGLVAFFGLGILTFTVSQYMGFERIVNMGPWGGPEANVIRRSAERIMSELERVSLMSGKATYGRAFNFALDPNGIGEKVATCRRAIRFEPDRAIVFRCAVLFALDRRQDEAVALMDRAVLSFPAEALTVAVQLGQLARDLPQLRPLAAELEAQMARRRQQYPGVWNPNLAPSALPIL